MTSQSNNTIIGNFTRKKTVPSDKDFLRKVRVTFYHTKPGCYAPPPYQLKYRELSIEELKAIYSAKSYTN